MDLSTSEPEIIKQPNNLVLNDLFLRGFPWEVTVYISKSGGQGQKNLNIFLCCLTDYNWNRSVCSSFVTVKCYNRLFGDVSFFKRSFPFPCVFYVDEDPILIGKIAILEITSNFANRSADWKDTTMAIHLNSLPAHRVRCFLPSHTISLKEILGDDCEPGDSRGDGDSSDDDQPSASSGAVALPLFSHSFGCDLDVFYCEPEPKRKVVPKSMPKYSCSCKLLGISPNDTLYVGHRRSNQLHIWSGNRFLPKTWNLLLTIEMNILDDFLSKINSNGTEMGIFSFKDRYNPTKTSRLIVISLVSGEILSQQDFSKDVFPEKLCFLGLTYCPDGTWSVYGQTTTTEGSQPARSAQIRSRHLAARLSLHFPLEGPRHPVPLVPRPPIVCESTKDFRYYRLIGNEAQLITQLDIGNGSLLTHCSSSMALYIWTKEKQNEILSCPQEFSLHIYDFNKLEWSTCTPDEGVHPKVEKDKLLNSGYSFLMQAQTISQPDVDPIDRITLLQLYKDGQSCMVFSIQITEGLYSCIPKYSVSHSFSLKGINLMFGNDKLTILRHHKFTFIINKSLNLITDYTEPPNLKQLALMALQKQKPYGLNGGYTQDQIDTQIRLLQLAKLQENMQQE